MRWAGHEACIKGRDDLRNLGVGEIIILKWQKEISSLSLINHHVMKTYTGVEIYLDAFLTSPQDGSEWSTSGSGRITAGERAPSSQWI
jgi:hypothetical protein